MLKDWQNKFNLVSTKSLDSVWQRHVADSYQLCQYIGKDIKTIYDIGSGAGFPALVLAVWASEERPDISFKLIESITKKTLFLNAVKKELCLDNIEVINERSESLKIMPADIITARAVASLDKLFGFSKPLCSNRTVLLFLKGKSYEEEISEAQKHWLFNYQKFQSQTDLNGVILKISGLRKRK